MDDEARTHNALGRPSSTPQVEDAKPEAAMQLDYFPQITIDEVNDQYGVFITNVVACLAKRGSATPPLRRQTLIMNAVSEDKMELCRRVQSSLLVKQKVHIEANKAQIEINTARIAEMEDEMRENTLERVYMLVERAERMTRRWGWWSD